MKRSHFAHCVVAALFVLCPALLHAALQLTPIVSGLSQPVFVGHAGDGSGRLFIVQQGGLIKVLQPGSSTPTDFLNISAKVQVTSERGLLGLAFHPQYSTNRRFFVYYTRRTDGALVIAAYRAFAANPNLADPTERIYLTIPHPTFLNHNGGMLAFGVDGYLYAGVGDGGSGNDPPSNAQNKDVLLGKILRINVDQPNFSAGVLYSSPPDNPFVGVPGRDEIFALGMRNPWRFSFDRLTGQMWVGDVGQGAREEVDTPIVNGGNYGWRIYEGTQCTGNDPGLCNPANYIPPVFDYSHSAGRCSLTGGYVYRGQANALPSGTYLYADFCTGEIFSWNGSTQTLVLDTALNISSFGEDEQGEIYVVNIGGTISRIDSTASCTYAVTPGGQSFGAGGGNGTAVVTVGAGCGWTAVANAGWIHVTSGSPGTGTGSVGYSVDVNGSLSARNGTMTIAGTLFTVSQAGATGCSYAIAPTSASFGKNPGLGNIGVTASAGCAWTAVSNAPWLFVNASGSGNGTVTYLVQKFAGTQASRTGTIAIGGNTFTVTQVR